MNRAATSAVPIGFVEFVLLCASMMALNAIGIDSMLPALPAIGESMGVASPNHRQFVITAYLVGFAVAQIFYGPISDRYGRRPVLLFALAAYAITSVLAAAAGDLTILLAARVAMGMAAAGARVITVAMIRDCFAGREMARVMSLASMVFMAAPVLAPAFGTAILTVGPWRWVFWGIALSGLIVLLWFGLRMRESLPVDRRQSLRPGRILTDYRRVLQDRQSVGYTIAGAAVSGGLFGFIGSIQQIVDDVFHRPGSLTLVFAGVAGTMAVCALLNSRIVVRVGMRPISHSALTVMTVLAAVHLAIAWSGAENFWIFVVLQALMLGCLGLVGGNFSALAMEHMGDFAGTASSLQGFVSMLGGALAGAAIGQAFDGTTVPLYLGCLVAGLSALVVVAITERGRLYRAH